jgi:hypothetical protein
MTTPWNDTYKTKRAQTAAILPSDTKPIRTAPMTAEEFDGYLARIRRDLRDAGAPLVRRDGLAVREKAEREAAHELRGMIEKARAA